MRIARRPMRAAVDFAAGVTGIDKSPLLRARSKRQTTLDAHIDFDTGALTR